MLKKLIKCFVAIVFIIDFAYANESFITLEKPILYPQKSVIEIFSYKCIHCYNHHKFNTLGKLKQVFPDLHYEIYPSSMMAGKFGKELNELFAYANFKDKELNYDAADLESLSHKLADAYFRAYFVNKQEFENLNDFIKVGLNILNIKDKELQDFLKTKKAHEILDNFEYANELARTYGTPSFIVNGKYQINPEFINSLQSLVDFVKYLSQK